MNTNTDEVVVAEVHTRPLTLGHVGMGTGTVEPFDALYPGELRVRPLDIEEGKIDALVIWGGEDISPTIYGEPVNGAYASKELSHRDMVEKAACQAAIKKGIPIIGVCRGAQLLCAMAGGKLYQHVSGHHGAHHITTKDGEDYITSSIHHQMMDVNGLPKDDYEMIAWSKLPLAKEVKNAIEPEIVYFKKINGLAIQGHPEFMHPDDDFVLYTQRLVAKYLMKEKVA